MGQELKYKITFAADNSGARSAADALNAMGGRAGAAQQAFVGMEMAARGNVSALFGVARAARVLWQVFATAAPIVRILTLIAIAISLAGKAWSDYKGRQKEAAEATAEATEKLIAAQQRLHAVIAARREPNYRAQAEAISEIAAAYDEAAQAAANYAKAQDAVAAAQTATEIARVTEAEQRALGVAAGPAPETASRQAEIALNADRKRIRIQYVADYAAIERNKKAGEDRIAQLKIMGNALTRQAITVSGMFTTPLSQAEAQISAISKEMQAQRNIMGEKQNWAVRNKGWIPDWNMLPENKAQALKVATAEAGYPESVEKLAEATATRDKLKAESDKVKADLEAKLRATAAERTAAESEVALAPAKKEQLAAESAAQEAALNAAEANRTAAEKKLDIESRNLKIKEAMVEAAEDEADAAKIAGDWRAMQLEDELAITRLAQQWAEAQAQKLRARILSPAAGRAQDKEEREAKREEDRVEKRIARAEAERARGGRGKWIEEALTFRGARAEAAAKKAEISALELEAVRAAINTAATLVSIKTSLETNLQAVN